MKKRGFILLLSTIFLASSLVSAEITFFEGELGYRDDFIMVQEEQQPTEKTKEISPIDERRGTGGGLYCGEGACRLLENCSNCAEDCGVCLSELREVLLNEPLICNIVFESLRLHIQKEKNIDYTSPELELLTSQINTLAETSLTLDQTNLYLSQFENLCDLPYPLSGSFILGKESNIRVIIQISSLLILALILYLLFRERKEKAFK